MKTKHKIIGISLLLGLPLLLLVTAPRSKNMTATPVSSRSEDLSSPLTEGDNSAAQQDSSVNSLDTSSNQTPTTSIPSYSYTAPTPAPPTATYPKPITAPSSAPSAWTSTSGVLNGTYHYVVTYVSNTGQETDASPASLGVTPNGQQIWVTSIPTSGNNNVQGRNLYRTLANASTVGPYYSVISLNDNSTSTYYDNTPDNTLKMSSPHYF